MASAAQKHDSRKTWTKPVLRKLEGEEADRARRIFMEKSGLADPAKAHR